MSVGFVGGGGRRLVESIDAKLSDSWEGRWLVGNREDPERKTLFLIWWFWLQQIPVPLRVEQEFFKAFCEFEASGNSAPTSRDHFVVRSES
jgi:hypothetical protein